MYYKSDVSGFVDALKELSEQRRTTTAVFFSAEGGWGKVQLRQGIVCSVRYQLLKGPAALPAIRQLDGLQYQFRDGDSGTTAEKKPCDLKDNEFFSYFQVSVVRPDQPRPASPARREKPSKPAPNYKKFKVLVADDSRIARKSISRILLENGFNVIEAENGFEALGQLENERPDLLLLDLIMPGVDGYRVLESIRKKPMFTRLPVFILTSRDGLMDKIKGKMSESNEYLTKPVSAELLMEKIRRYLD